jgi:glutamyl endopeptidase
MMAGKSKKAAKQTGPSAESSSGASEQPVAQRKAVPDANKDPWALESFMEETNGGGAIEQVPGFNVFRAVTAGFATQRIAGPTTVLARPDGGFFSEGGLQQPLLPASTAGSSRSKLENVIGVDSRVLVADTSPTPWRCICHLEVEYEYGPVGYGTGFLIGPNWVMTAAHVLVNPSKNEPTKRRKARQVRVIPGRNGTLAPYGYFVSQFSDCMVPEQWLSDGEDQPGVWDFAMISIPKSTKNTTEGLPTAERLGYFGLKCFPDDEVPKMQMLFVNNAGYPYEADKAYGTLWYNAGRVHKVDETQIEYMVDTEGGQSGSPVYYFDKEKNQRYVIAIHTTGDFINRGLRITEKVFTMIKKWTRR